jgi:hypothetical protein
MRVGLASFIHPKSSCIPVYALIDFSVNLIIRKTRLIAMAFCLLVSLLPMQPSAVALPNSQPVGASGKASRVVPIFNSANSQQPVMTGYLYSSRIVFAIDPASGSQDFYVGLPKSLASTTGGRVKVAKVFASQSIPAMISNYSFAFNRFAIFVLEKDLIAATPAELLTPEMDIGSKGDFPGVTTAYSYGEYQNRTSPGSQKPCEGGPCSKDVRSLQLKILALKGKPPVSVMPNFRDQFIGQIILENSVDPKAGIACYGDGGAPVVASYRNRELYMGAIADQFYVKACGAFPQATYDKDGKMIKFGYDTDIAINFISPVYKHTDLINRAKEYAKTLATPSPTPSTKSETPSPTPSTKNTKTATEIEDCWALVERRRHFQHVRRVNDVEVILVAKPEETAFRFFRGVLTQNPSEKWITKYKNKNYKICRIRLKEDPTFSANVIAYKTGPVLPAVPVIATTVTVEKEHDVLLLEASTAIGKSLDYRMMGPGQDVSALKNWCSANSALPLAGLFQASEAMAGLLTTRLGALKKGGIPAAVTSFGLGGVAVITNMGIDNVWDYKAGYGLVSGPIQLVLESDKKIPETLFVKGIPMKVTNVVKQFKKAGIVGKTFVVASVYMTIDDAADLGEAIGEITYGLDQKEFQKICNRSGL